MARLARHPFVLIIPAILFLGLAWPSVTQAGPNPVEDLRKALENREDIQVIKQHIARLKTVPDLLEASRIGYLSTVNVDENQNKLLDQEVREPLKKKLQEIVQKGDADTKLALATRLAAFEVKSNVQRDLLFKYAEFVRSLSQNLEGLIVAESSTPAIRQAAAFGLGKLLIHPEKAVTALKSMLGKNRTFEEKKAAVNALFQMVDTHDKLYAIVTFGEALSLADVLQVTREAVKGARLGLAQAEPPVRQGSLQVLLRVGQLLGNEDLLRYPPKTTDKKMEIEDLEKLIHPTLQEFGQAIESAPFIQGLTKADAVSQYISWRALENLATVRLRINLRRSEFGLPPRNESEDPLLKGLKQGVQSAAKEIQDSHPSVRLIVAEFAERMGEPAFGLTQELAVRLHQDPSTFVRWAAGRALARFAYIQIEPLVKGDGKLPVPEQPLKSVVLHLSAALAEKDLAVRVAIADMLGGLAYLAQSIKDDSSREKAVAYFHLGVPGMINGALIGDPESRIAVLKILTYTGVRPDQAESTAKALISLLEFPDAPVRQAAADALGKMGPAANSAIAALLQAANDDDDLVRRAASDALLRIKK